MSDDLTKYRGALARAWVKRRAAQGIVMPADDLWLRIRKAWPTASDEASERIFQEASRP